MSFGNLKNKCVQKIEKISKSLPITAKVTLWYTSFIAIILLVLLFFSIRATAVMVRNSDENHLIKKVTEKVFDPKSFESIEDGILYSVIENGEVIAGSYPKLFDGSIPISSGAVTNLKIKGEEYLYYDVLVQNRPVNRWIRGVLPISRSRANMKSINWALILLSPLMLAVISFGGYRIIKRAFQPVKKLSETAQKIEESKDFSKRLYVSDTKDEIHQMSLVLNDMLGSLEQSYNKEKQFSNDVSHELRTPVSVILSESEYGIRYLEDVHEAKESFEVIHRQSLRMSSMIKAILELSRIDNMSHLQKESIDLSQFMNHFLEEQQARCEEKDILLSSSIEDNLTIEANLLLFERVLDNLFSNALKFTEDRIEVITAKTDQGISISIKDNGIGLTEQESQQIFRRFYQVESSRSKKQNPGVGLGLSLVDKILQLHGWAIDVESQPGKVSRFTLLIPDKNSNPEV